MSNLPCKAMAHSHKYKSSSLFWLQAYPIFISKHVKLCLKYMCLSEVSGVAAYTCFLSTSATMTLAKQEQVLHITLWRYWQVWDYVLVSLTQKKKSIIDLHKLWMSLMVFVRIKAEHECTCGWPGSVPMGISNSKCHTQICVGFSHWMTQSHGAKTHRFLSTCGSTGTWKYLQVLRVLNRNKID